MYMRWVHKPYQMNHAFKHHYWPPFEKFLKKLKGFKSTKSDNEMALRLVPTWSTSADLSRLILERSSDWPCDWSCNITVMNTCSLALADERRFLSSWFDLTASSIMLTSSIHIHPSSFLASKSCRVARYLVTWPCESTHIEPCWPLCSIPVTMPLLQCDSCEHYWNRMLIKQKTSEIIISNSNVSPAMSHVCHMYSCHNSPAIFVCPAIPAIIISTMRLTMTPFFRLQYVGLLRLIMLLTTQQSIQIHAFNRTHRQYTPWPRCSVIRDVWTYRVPRPCPARTGWFSGSDFDMITHRAGMHHAGTHHDLNAVTLRAFIFHCFSMISIICYAEFSAGFGTKTGPITVVKKSLRLAEC